MANGISQLENRNWRFKGDVQVDGHLNSSRNRYELVEDFRQLPSINASIAVSTNLDFEVLGTNASADDVIYSTTVAGIQLETDGADNDQVIILPHLDASQTAWAGVLWGTENQVIWEATIRTGATITSYMVWAGLKLTNTSTIATDADQIFFRFSTDDSDTNWRLISSIGGADTNTDSGLAFAASTIYRLKISIDSARAATFYINDVAYYTTAALTNDIDLIPYVGIQDLAAASARNMVLCNEKISRIFF